MANFGPLTAEIDPGVCGAQVNFKGFRVLASLLQRRRSPEATKLFARCLAVPPNGILPAAKFTLCLQVFRSPILAALLHGTRAVGVSQSFRRGTRNGITELSQRAPPMFSRAAITLGIGPHSSSDLYCSACKASLHGNTLFQFVSASFLTVGYMLRRVLHFFIRLQEQVRFLQTSV